MKWMSRAPPGGGSRINPMAKDWLDVRCIASLVCSEAVCGGLIAHTNAVDD